jgi:hypothetical protein
MNPSFSHVTMPGECFQKKALMPALTIKSPITAAVDFSLKNEITCFAVKIQPLQSKRNFCIDTE